MTAEPQLLHSIPYVFVFSDIHDAQATPFQGFTFETIILSAIANKIIQEMPASPGELFWARSEIVENRGLRGNGYLIQMGSLSNLSSFLDLFPKGTPVVVIPDRASEAEVKALCAEREFMVSPFDLVRPAPFIEVSWKCTRTEIKEYVFSLLGLDLSTTSSRSEKTVLPATGNTHLTTQPNLLALHSIGYQFSSYNWLTPRDDYEQAIISSADQLRDAIRSDGLEQRDIMVVSPGIALQMHSRARELSFKAFPDDRDARRIMLSMLKRKGYSTLWKLDADQDDKAWMQKVASSPCVVLRRLELYATAAFSSVRAASKLTPTYRLPELTSELFAPLGELANATDLNPSNRSSAERQRRKVNKCARKLNAVFSASVPPKILEIIRNGDGLIGNWGEVPLELLDVDGVPLSMRREITRIPVVPGNGLFRHAMRNSRIHIKAEELCDITIIRALLPSDRLYGELVNRLTSLMADMPELKVTVRDVANKAEFVDAIRTNNSELVIVDCHGGYDARSHRSGLKIGRKLIDVSEALEGERAPSLVILSACNTHPLNGSHVSAVNGFLEHGSFSVLGTLLPIHGQAAALLVERIVRYLISWSKRGRGAVRWSGLISMALRTQYLGETCSVLAAGALPLTPRRWQEVYENAVAAVPHGTEWPTLVDELSVAADVQTEEIRELMRRETFLGHAAMYVHFGVPENVAIVNPEGPLDHR